LIDSFDFFDLRNNRLTESTTDPLLLENENISYTYTYDDAGYALTRKDNKGMITSFTYIIK